MLKPLIKGLATYIPGVYRLFSKKKAGNSASARYCYSIWMRHLVYLYENGYRTIPKSILELGPGDSIGAGLAALVSGVERYYALDVEKYSTIKKDEDIFNEIVDLYRNRANIPDNNEFRWINPVLKSYNFPHHIFTEEQLVKSLSNSRIKSIQQAIYGKSSVKTDHIIISYIAPWYDTSEIESDPVDLVFSHTVLEHVNDLTGTYDALNKCLKTGGTWSHLIDFKFPQTPILCIANC